MKTALIIFLILEAAVFVIGFVVMSYIGSKNRNTTYITSPGYFTVYPKFEFLFKWYDVWIGVFIDRKKNDMYVFILPMIGFVIRFGTKD